MPSSGHICRIDLPLRPRSANSRDTARGGVVTPDFRARTAAADRLTGLLPAENQTVARTAAATSGILARQGRLGWRAYRRRFSPLHGEGATEAMQRIDVGFDSQGANWSSPLRSATRTSGCKQAESARPHPCLS